MRFMRRTRGTAGRFIRRATTSDDGFTLIELIVVIAILGILIAIAIPTIRGFLDSSRKQAYEADRRVIQLAVDAYYYSPSNKRFNNDRQYPIMGKRYQDPAKDDRGFAETHARFHLDKCVGDDADDPIEFVYEDKYDDDPLPGHPVLGTRGGAPIWTEGTGANHDDLRNGPLADKRLLYCPPEADAETDSDSETSDRDSEDRPDHWLAVALTTQGEECNLVGDTGCVVISTRDYLIDFCELVWGGFIEEIPQSASNDHDHQCIRGGADTAESTPTQDRGSYTWYVDVNGKVQSLYFFLPTENSNGFRDVYP